MSQIRTSVSCYSLQDSYARGRLDLPGILDFVADQMIKGTPFPSDETVAGWHKALDASGLVPVCNDIFINSTLYRNRTLRVPEQVELLKRDLDVSKRLGFDLVRLVSDTPGVTVTPSIRWYGRVPAQPSKEVREPFEVRAPVVLVPHFSRAARPASSRASGSVVARARWATPSSTRPQPMRPR